MFFIKPNMNSITSDVLKIASYVTHRVCAHKCCDTVKCTYMNKTTKKKERRKMSKQKSKM